VRADSPSRTDRPGALTVLAKQSLSLKAPRPEDDDPDVAKAIADSMPEPAREALASSAPSLLGRIERGAELRDEAQATAAGGLPGTTFPTTAVTSGGGA
jgi:hypothetical protein